MDTYIILSAIGLAMTLCFGLGYLRGRHDVERQRKWWPVMRVCARGEMQADMEVLRGDLLPDGVPVILYAQEHDNRADNIGGFKPTNLTP